MTDVLSKNLFDLLGDDGEEGAVRAPAPVKKEEKKDAAPAPKKDNAPARAPRNEYRPRGGAQRGGDRVARNGPRETGDFERPPREGQREGQDGQRGGFRGGRGGPRGGRGAGGRGREFDRRSGTGRRDTEKKEVAGKGSWGEPIASQQEGTKVAEQEIAVAEGAEGTPEENPAADKPADAEAEAAKEPEEVLKTLDQYFAEREAKKGAADVAVRKANEGADESQWKDAVVFQKEEEDYFIGKSAKGKRAAQTPKEKQQKVFAAIEQRFADEGPKRGGGGRGGRGRGGDRPEGSAGGRGRGGERRGGRGGNNASVNVSDEKAFPTLGSK
ncbi:hypothetical protein HDV00_009807 [Rhizophlyctis rosea]|nr:hypothetical protein HDV00_009807 [Rhizophlyctis rosea]